MAVRLYGIGTLVVLIATALWFVQAAADVQVGSGFQAGEAVQSIRLEITVAADGEDLDEPVALDLGLGFPLWLHRLGRVENSNSPFGAVCQRGTDAHALRAGERATFEFSTSGAAGQDGLRTTQQLLAAVQVSDISRIGFTSKADHGWVIASYKIDINGKPFIANSTVNANGRGLQDTARERLSELNRDLAPQQVELTDLEALAAASLASEADRTRLTELKTSLAPRIAEQRRIERQLRGAAPFFTESGFRPQWRSNGTIESVKVTVITAPHSGADTRNYVYFQAGGHKYLLGSALQPLSPDYGAQEFSLDLATAPLTASDLRGYGLGVLAHPEPSGDVPDRWHPQRLRIEVDGRVVYDSEDNAIDRNSLSAIRLIPPAQMNADGQAVENKPVAREAFVWTVGSGAGLDLENGGPAALPAEGDPAYPNPEPGVVIDQDINIVEETWYDPSAGPFPGEAAFGPGWQPGFIPGYGPGWDPTWGPGWDPGWGPGWTAGPSWLDLLALGLLEHLGLLPDWVVPDPVGQPPQLEQVQVDFGTHTVHWTITGDASQIDHFVVDMVRIRPDQDVPISAVLTESLEVAAHERSLPLSSLVPMMSMETMDASTRGYSAIRVTMVPTDPAIGVDLGLAPAMPARVMIPGQSIYLNHQFEYTPMGGVATYPAVSLGGEPELPGRAVWAAGEIASNTGLVFAGVSPLQHHIVARAENEGDVIQVRLYSDVLPPGSYRVIAFVGFQGAVESPAEVNVSSNVVMTSVLNPALHIGYPTMIHVTADPSLPPTHMVPLITDFTTGDLGPGPMTLDIRYQFNNIHFDPQHPPVLIGVRLIHM